MQVAFEVLGSHRHGNQSPQHEPTVFRHPSQISLADRPPPIPAPARRSSSRSLSPPASSIVHHEAHLEGTKVNYCHYTIE